jgi:hypothetical protein
MPAVLICAACDGTPVWHAWLQQHHDVTLVMTGSHPAVVE